MRGGRGRGRGRGGGRSSKAQSDTHLDEVSRRLLSASRLRINDLQNQLEDTRKHMKVVVDENKLFKRMQHKQEKKLEKYEDRESDLPQLITSHNNEVRSLREQLRRMKEKYDKTDRYLRDAEDELETAKSKVKKYKGLSEQKNLAERSELDKKVRNAELSLEEKDSRIKELERHLEMLKKNHRHELGIERARSKDTQKQLDDMRENYQKTEAALKEKEKQLDAKNIYSNRFLKPASYSGTPADSPSFRPNLNKIKSGSVSDLTPRDKAKAYEDKRKAEEKKKEKSTLSEQNMLDGVDLDSESENDIRTESRQKSDLSSRPPTRKHMKGMSGSGTARRERKQQIERKQDTETQIVRSNTVIIDTPKDGKSTAPSDTKLQKQADVENTTENEPAREEVEGNATPPKFRLPKVQSSPRRGGEPPTRAKEPKQKWEVEEREKDSRQDHRGGGDNERGPNFKFDSLQREDSESDFWRRQEDKYKRDQDNRTKQDDNDHARFQQQRDHVRQDMEDRERAERERREADDRDRERREKEDRERLRREKEDRDRERREREDKEKREREDKEKDERDRRERSDRERREKLEQQDRERKEKEEHDRKVREERERLDNDPTLAEQKRKKEELLRRLQQIDANRDGSQPDASDPFAPSDSTRSHGAKDDPFSTSPTRRRTSGKDLFSSRPDSGEKKDYNFTRSIENMHKGKPSREDVSIPYIDRQKKARAAKEEAEIGGYQPSFAPSSKPPPSSHKKPMSLFDDDPKLSSKPPAGGSQDKKSKLMADLFGSQASSTTKSPSKQVDDSEEFFLTNKTRSKEPASKRSGPGFPWESTSSVTKTNGSAQRESSTIFGGGAALVDDDTPGTNKSTLLPKRQRQPSSTLSSKPAVVAVDNFDDDIEEVIL